MEVVVVGSGPAAVWAAIGAKKQDPRAEITLVTNEGVEPYEKPPLSKGILTGDQTLAEIPIAGRAGLAAYGVKTFHGEAVCLQRASRRIEFHNKSLSYEKAILATGSTCRALPFLPLGTPRICYLRTADDALYLKQAMQESRHMVVIGGGLIGLEVASSAQKQGMAVTVVELGDRLLARGCLPEISQVILDEHRKRGVQVELGVSVLDCQSSLSGRVILRTTSGKLEADLVVVGIGVEPNVALAKAALLEVGDGILVDNECRTSDDTIYAAGDVTSFPLGGARVRLENWTHAQAQGEIAGRNAVGGSLTYAPVPYFWSKQFGLYLQAVGIRPNVSTRVRRDLGGGSVIYFEIVDGTLRYAEAINAQAEISTSRRLIERGSRVDERDLMDHGYQLIHLLNKS